MDHDDEEELDELENDKEYENEEEEEDLEEEDEDDSEEGFKPNTDSLICTDIVCLMTPILQTCTLTNLSRFCDILTKTNSTITVMRVTHKMPKLFIYFTKSVTFANTKCCLNILLKLRPSYMKGRNTHVQLKNTKFSINHV